MLSGDSGCGKTTTLNLVYDAINPQPANIIAQKKVLGNPVQKDFECIIRHNGKKVAFFTMGDYSTSLIAAFKEYAGLHCDVLVCACNVKHVRPYQQIQNYPHNIIDKTMPRCSSSNMIDRDRILQLL
jgi:ABC-type branched-subunit amino acid transport system ATPase component